MRSLGLSLVLVVVLSVIGAGWALDALFARLDQQGSASQQQRQALGAALARALDTPDATVPTVEYDIQILPADALALPPTLRSQLDNGQALTLQTVDGITEYHAMPATRRVLAIGMHSGERTRTPLRIVFTALFYFGIALPILLWLYPLIRRLQRLGKAAGAFGKGDLRQRVATSPRSRLHAIEAEFNQMAARIEGLVADNRLLTSAVSHDLRTPLARLRFGIDAIREEQRNEVRHRYLERLSNDLTAMENLVSVMLEFARLDQQLQALPLDATDLHTLIAEAIDMTSDQGMGPAVLSTRSPTNMREPTRIHWQSTESTPAILANARYAGMLINNLLQNAIRHGRGEVRVSTREQNGRVRLTIEDNGPGIPAAERQEVLKPFIRGASGNDAQMRGYGLGLAIVSRIATWHDASIDIADSDTLGGASVSVSFLPATTPHRSGQVPRAGEKNENPVSSG